MNCVQDTNTCGLKHFSKVLEVKSNWTGTNERKHKIIESFNAATVSSFFNVKFICL